MLTLYIELLNGYLFQVTVIVYVFLGTTLEHFGSKFIEQVFGKHHQNLPGNFYRKFASKGWTKKLKASYSYQF